MRVDRGSTGGSTVAWKGHLTESRGQSLPSQRGWASSMAGVAGPQSACKVPVLCDSE